MARKRVKFSDTDHDQPHFPPERTIRLLVGIKSAIGMVESRAVSFEDLEQLSGRSAGTIASWMEGTRMQQLEFLFALLERVPPRLRHDLLDAACRTHPTLQHPRLAHDPIAVSRLEDLLERRTGLSVIHGAPEHARAFLLNALGNSTREVNFGQQPVVGIEIHRVASWAPALGILHISPHTEMRQQLQRAYSKIKQSVDGSMILLGGVWSRIPEVHSEIRSLSTRCHVIVADEFLKPEDLVRRVPGPVKIITIAPAREQLEWIRVTVQDG